MPMVTNVSSYVIHAGDEMLVPSIPCEVPDDVLKHSLMQQYIKDGVLQMGEVKVRSELVEDDEPEERRTTAPVRPQASPQPPAKK